MEKLSFKLQCSILDYFSDDELYYILKELKIYETVVLSILYRRLKCWGCVNNECGQEAHYEGCLN